MSAGVVVVGAGQAGFQIAASLREAGYADPITLIGDEADRPYQRPPLSKAYLAGKTDAAGLELRPAAYFADNEILHRSSVRVASIERPLRRVLCADGTALAYDHLVLATGARNRLLPVPGADRPGVFQLRGRADADALRAALGEARAVAIVGAGFIGLEFAGICAARGLAVTVVEAAERPMARAVSAETAAYFTRAHDEAGIRFVFGAGVTAIAGEARAESVHLRDGASLAADLVLVGIGVVPNQELAEAAGLQVGDGILVDAFLATDDPAISAIGDCARAPSRFADGAPVRVESVQNARDQGPHKLQIAGLATPSDTAVVRPVPAGLCVFRFRDGRLSAVETVDRPGDHMAARRILAQGRALSPEDAANPGHDLKALAMGR